MATTTPNFGWPVPTSSDLVKNGATAIEGLGDAIDASLLDLKGGTSGQVLAKASGTDMDFSWVTDATGIPATIFDAKGDIIAATAADTASRLAVGANDTVLTADSTTATGLKWATPASGSTFVGASVYKSGNQSITSGAVTNVSFDTENYDTNAFHDNSTNNSRMTIPTGYGGKYLITAKFYYDSNAAGYREMQIKKNGTQINFFYFPPNTTYVTQQGSIVLSLAAADYVELGTYQNTGGALNINGGADGTFFQISYLGA